MKNTTVVIVFVSILATSFLNGAFSQQASAPKTTSPLVSQTLAWMLGDWEGEGVQNGTAFSSTLSVTTKLDGTVIQISRSSSSGLKEMMLLGFDGSSKKYVGVLYDSRNHIGLFECQMKENEIGLNQFGLPQGFQSSRTIKLQPDTKMYFSIDRAEPGQQLSKSVEITYQKK
jgi:hypothetical protein